MISSEKKTDETENDHVLAPEDIKIDTTPASYPTIIIKGLFVHSQRDPVREAQRLVETAIGNNTGGATSGDNSGNGAIIVLGFGLGYTAQALAQTVTKGRPVIIVEKYKNLLTKAFELRDLSDFLIRENVIFVVGGTGDGILDALAAVSKVVSPQFAGGISTEGKSESLVQPTVQPTIIKNRTLCDIDADWYKAVENKIRTWAMKDEVNAATLKRFGRRWVRNIMRNMSAVRDYPGISLLSGLAADCNAPVFLAAAGPSLDKIAPLLRDIHSRCIIAAVDTSLRFFVNNGIQPDFVLVVDPQFWNSRHLDRCVNDKTILIAESAVYPPVLNQRFRKTFLCG
ncbi:MAG: DUF115 domain-containing protein, partial [Treponema sp.]|nr:DUF115 domain-containing protein [Treponema sp.]